MVTSTEQRHQLIARAVSHGPAGAADTSVAAISALRWRQLARQLCPIIGDGGFMALYLRSLHVARNQHNCLPQHDAIPVDAAFAALEQALRECPAAASSASMALLCTLIDTLISLIGELLTTSILREAWGDDVENHAGTELP